MRIITAEKFRACVARLCLEANFVLRKDVAVRLREACARESSPRAKKLIAAIIENSRVAAQERLAICQDTGLPTVFVELGQEAVLRGDIYKAINAGIADGYRKGSLRNSIIRDPLARGTPKYSPAVIHVDLVRGSRVKITVLPKGFGCENKSVLRMFLPTASIDEIKDFVVESVKKAGPDACPPYVVGVGIGGTADYAALLAKKALLRKLHAKRYSLYAKLEKDLLSEINKLNIGPMGLGGGATALAVNVETFPTHIAGLPVAVSISCHALRSASAIL